MLRLSVLDQSPISAGSNASDALNNSIDLARQTDALGYHRYWLAEHHNSKGLAGAAPEIMVGRIADATTRIRVGSGGVMLSHYSPFKVAETFRTLATLHPGRIDLGVGRAPGSDQLTAYALALNNQLRPSDYYQNDLQDLTNWLCGESPAESPFAGRIRALPASDCETPEVWVLASSPGSAGIAARLGLPLSFADFIATGDGPAICDAYRAQYEPSQRHPEPRINIGAGVICAETSEQAKRLATSVQLWRQRGLRGSIPSFDEVDEMGEELVIVQPGRKPMIVGDAGEVRTKIEALAEAYNAEEVVIVTIVHDHDARVESYKLIAKEFGLASL